MTHILLLIIGFALVLAGADSLVKGAWSLAKRLRVSDPVVGLTVAAFGTSMPEISVSTIASTKSNSDIFLGNIVGSKHPPYLFHVWPSCQGRCSMTLGWAFLGDARRCSPHAMKTDLSLGTI